MTVKELIETLKTCDENANVVIEQWDGDTFGIGEVNDYSSNIGEVIMLWKKLLMTFGHILDLFCNGLKMD